MGKTLEKWLKFADELDNKGGHPFYDRSYRPPFGEIYMGPNKSYHVHLSFRESRLGWPPRDYCVEFYRANSVCEIPLLKNLGYIVEKKDENLFCERFINFQTEGGYNYFDEAPVFVEVRQISELSEGVKGSRPSAHHVPSYIWLKPLIFCPVIRANFL